MCISATTPHCIYHYLSETDISQTTEWFEWLNERLGKDGWGVTSYSASYSGRRMVVFSFASGRDAALFRLLFGGSTVPTFSPTLR